MNRTPDQKMETKEIIERSRKFIAPYSVTNGKKFRLKDIDPGDTGEAATEDKPRAKELLEKGVEVLGELQDVLYAEDQWSILLIFQAMDAAGKDGAIKHVMSGVNPQGCQVFSFNANSEIENSCSCSCSCSSSRSWISHRDTERTK